MSFNLRLRWMYCNERCFSCQTLVVSNNEFGLEWTQTLCLLISPSTFPLSHIPVPLSLPTLCTCLDPPREESGQKPMVSSGTAKGHTDLDGPLFHRNGTKGDGGFVFVLVTKLSQTCMLKCVALCILLRKVRLSDFLHCSHQTRTRTASCQWMNTAPPTPPPIRPTVRTMTSMLSPSGTMRGSLFTALLKVYGWSCWLYKLEAHILCTKYKYI